MKKPPKFDPSQYEWTVSDRKPRNYAQCIKQVDPKKIQESKAMNCKENWNDNVVAQVNSLLESVKNC